MFLSWAQSAAQTWEATVAPGTGVEGGGGWGGEGGPRQSGHLG